MYQHTQNVAITFQQLSIINTWLENYSSLSSKMNSDLFSAHETTTTWTMPKCLWDKQMKAGAEGSAQIHHMPPPPGGSNKELRSLAEQTVLKLWGFGNKSSRGVVAGGGPIDPGRFGWECECLLQKVLIPFQHFYVYCQLQYGVEQHRWRVSL